MDSRIYFSEFLRAMRPGNRRFSPCVKFVGRIGRNFADGPSSMKLFLFDLNLVEISSKPIVRGLCD